MKLKSLAVIAGMLALTGVSQAEDVQKKTKPKKEIPAKILEKYDEDKDGKLNKEERAELKKDQAENQKENKKDKPKKKKKGKKKGGKKNK